MPASTGLFVLTTRRLLFAPSAPIARSETVVELPEVLSVAARRSTAGWASSTSPPARAASSPIRSWATRRKRSPLAVQQAKNPPPDGPARRRDPLEELAELRVLHQAGAIGDAEYQARKQQLFGQI